MREDCVVGLTAVNALSSEFQIISYREGEKYKHTITFKDGVKVEDTKVKLTKSMPQHGCEISFIPSKKFLGANTHIPIEEVYQWVNLMAYLIPQDKKIKIKTEIWDGAVIEEEHKIKLRPFSDILKEMIGGEEPYSPTMNMTVSHTWEEESRGLSLDKNGKPIHNSKKVQRYLTMEFSICYMKSQITQFNSFCNFTNTTQGGVHEDALIDVICRKLIANVKESVSETFMNKYKPIWDDVRSGMCCVINLNTNAEVGFVGNAKEKIDSKPLFKILKDVLMENITKYLAENKDVLTSFTNIVKTNAKARVDIQKIKEASQTESMDSLKELELHNFVRCNNKRKNDFREIFLVEGNSASGGIASACFPDTQALYLFRGVTKNAAKWNYTDIMQNPEWKGLVVALRAGVGPSFKLENLWFKRINIFTDSDIDGYYITMGILTFLYYYMRPAIEAGYVYKVMSPLYRIEHNGKTKYVTRRSECTDLLFKYLVKHAKVSLLEYKGIIGPKEKIQNKLSKDEMYDFLYDTKDYSEILKQRVADLSGKLDPLFVEYILALLCLGGGVNDTWTNKEINDLLNNQKFIKSFMSRLQVKYPESTLNGNMLSSSVNGRRVTLTINKIFIHKASELFPVFTKWGYQIAYGEDKKDERYFSIEEFLQYVEKYNPVITARYKGLGELNVEDIHEQVMDINNRTSIQFTIDDVEKELEIFNKLMGSRKKDLEGRKKMMRDYRIAKEDLDN